MFLDQDDRYNEKMCEVMYEKIQRMDVDIVMCNYRSFLHSNFTQSKDDNLDLSFIKENPKENELIFNDIFMWNKIFKRDFLLKNDIKCPEKYLSEDMVFCVNAYLNTDEVVYLNRFEGYLYNIRDTKEDASTSNSISKESYLKLLEGYYATVDLFKKAKREDLIEILMKAHFVTLISSFIRLNDDVDKKSKVNILEKLYEFKEYSNINYDLNEKWTKPFIRNLEKKHFNLIILESNLIKQFYKSQKLRKIYRKFYNKSDY